MRQLTMTRRRAVKAASAALITLAGLLAAAPAALAQGCALCYNNAAATGPQGQAALRHGILVLMIPPMLMFAAMFGLLYRRRNLHHDAILPVSAKVSRHSVSEIVLHLN